MANTKLSPELLAELAMLKLLPDEDIDTDDIPEVTDWSNARRAAFYEGKLETRNYNVAAIANWFLDRLQRANVGVSNLSLNKIVFFAVERALVENSVLLTPARIEAWNHGPVFREIYHALKGNESSTIRSRISTYSIPLRRMVEAKEDFLPADVALFERVAESYGKMSASRLVTLSHREKEAWYSVWHFRGRTNPGMEISPAIILRTAPQQRNLDG